MKVGIIGAGAIGLLLAAHLTKTHDVTIITRTKEQQEVLNQEGIIYCGKNTFQDRSIVATTELAVSSEQDLLILAVKSWAVSEVLKQLTNYSQIPPLIFIQNGYAHVEEMLGTTGFYFSTIEHGVEKVTENKIKHHGIGRWLIGCEEQVNWYAQLKKSSTWDFPVERKNQVEDLLERKLWINCCINPLTAVLHIRNGELLTNPIAYQLMEQVYKELITAQPRIQAQVSFEEIKKVCQKTAMNRSSMLVDLVAGRPMEIYSIVTVALQRLQKPAPLLQHLEQLLLALEERRE